MKPSLTHGVAAVVENLRFFTRLPLGESVLAPDFRRIGWGASLAGAIVGTFGAAAFLVSLKLGFPRTVAATLAVAAEVAIAGSLHEDGLADVFDGFGGGYDRETKLAIMRDSRIGAYGAIALFLVLLLRIEIISALSRPFPGFAAAAMVLAAAAARAAALAPLAWAQPTRTDGAGASIGLLAHHDLFGVAAVLLMVAATVGLFWLGVVRAIFSCVVGAAITWLLVASAKRQIGGQTGDVCGAAAALAEVAVMLALLIGGREA